MCKIQIFLSNQRRIWYCTWKDQNRHGFLRQDVKHISLNIPQYTAIINKYKQSPFPADSEWKRAGEKKKKKVCICFLYNFGMHSGFTPGSREREAEDAILVRISCLKRAWIFSSTLSIIVPWPWEQDIFRSTLTNSERLFCRWRDEGQFSQARDKLTHCILRRWHRRCWPAGRWGLLTPLRLPLHCLELLRSLQHCPPCTLQKTDHAWGSWSTWQPLYIWCHWRQPKVTELSYSWHPCISCCCLWILLIATVNGVITAEGVTGYFCVVLLTSPMNIRK